MSEYFWDIAEKKISRRSFAKGLLAATALTAIPFKSQASKGAKDISSSLKYQNIISWGDPLFGGDAFDIYNFSKEAQLSSFGYDNDFIAFMSLGGSERGLLCVNHENTDRRLMFPPGKFSEEEQIEIEMAAHGHSVVEVILEDGKWRYVNGGKYNRRISALETEFGISGPVADYLDDYVVGTVNNCSGGVTPWETVLFCEENFNSYFYGEDEQYGINKDENRYSWHRYDKRFADMKEAERFGWVCEFDPFDPSSKPVKRTALGRFKHEGAYCTKAHDGKIVVYMGDDEAFQHIYKYVGNNLDDGDLYVAKFSENSVEWLPIPKEELVNTRAAAKKLGATTMDRPESIVVNELTGKVYVALTKNPKRLHGNVANPNVVNKYGHILELSPSDHAELEHGWDFYLFGNEQMACPDNIAFDGDGQMWICTDGMDKAAGKNDGLFVVDEKRKVRQVLEAPVGAETTGPAFTPNYEHLFLAIQHPGQGSGFANPSTRWPDFDTKNESPPRPGVIALEV